ncbi:amidohydrolase family protein [SAR202 cluster bacterium AD-804-J14_MRT_500m]|nr:amidohydrolase family protein [SAR202 cluster bacterium AD-804-J14_MRT_500m]
MYDVILKGGTVVDCAQDWNRKMDIAITGDKISKVASNIPSEQAPKVLDVTGKVVAPGLIDVHAHMYLPKKNPAHPDSAGVWGGVTTVADAGSSGPSNFAEFSDVVLDHAQTKVYSFLSIFHDRSVPATDLSHIDKHGVLRVAEENPEIVKGVKCLVTPRLLEALGLNHVKAATEVARDAGLKVMLHIGDIGPKNQTPTSPEIVRKALSMLSAGDIVTHIFTPLTGAALDWDGNILPELKEAQDRGIVLDPSYGDFNFGWERAADVMAQGVVPDTIGTDIDIQPGYGIRNHMMRGLLEYSAFFLELGFSVEDVIRMTTINAAKALGIEYSSGSLAEGREADVSVIEVIDGEWELKDATGEIRVGKKSLVPFLTVKSGKIVDSGEAPHPWGWGPPAIANAEVAAADGDAD